MSDKIPIIGPASTTPLIIISASPTIFVMIRTCTTAPAPATISFPPTIPVTIRSLPTPTATSPSVIPVPMFIPMSEKSKMFSISSYVMNMTQ